VRAAWLFILPTIVGFALFVAGPIIASIALAFTKYDVVNPPQGVGLANFREAFSDDRVRTSFRNTIVFVLVATALQIALALALAVGIQRRMPAALRYFFRTAFFLPIITSAASISIVFGYMFNKEFGVVNYYLDKLHIGPIPWLVNTHWSLYSVAVAYVWQHVGFTFILFSAGLTNISREIYEAAEIDGVNAINKFFRITLPLLSPTILFTTVIGMISSLQVFDQPTVMTNGGPGDSSRTVVMIIYDVAFRNLRFGYGSAIAVLLFVVILAFTGLQFLLSKRFVFYK
jgi:multiple sugar transport system permease protein